MHKFSCVVNLFNLRSFHTRKFGFSGTTRFPSLFFRVFSIAFHYTLIDYGSLNVPLQRIECRIALGNRACMSHIPEKPENSGFRLYPSPNNIFKSFFHHIPLHSCWLNVPLQPVECRRQYRTR